MSWKLRLFIMSLVGAAALAACSTGGFTAPPGIQCYPNGYEYIPVQNLPATQKITLNADTNIAEKSQPGGPPMAAGIYNYAQSSLFYEDTTPNITSPLAIDVSDTASTASSPEAMARPCVLNFAMGLSGVKVQAYMPSTIKIDGNLNQQISFRQFQLTIDKGNITIAVTPEDPSLDVTNMDGNIPQPGIPNVKLAINPNPVADPNPVMLKYSPTVYEYRAKYTYSMPGDSHTYNFYVSSHLNVTPYPYP